MAANPDPRGGGQGGPARTPSWQEKLDEYCRSAGASAPAYDIASDRRGGRTAWTATVQIASLQQRFQARFWYDGQYVNNAKEDAAEVALIWFQRNAPQGGPSASAGPGPSGAGTAGGGSGNGLQLRGGAATPAFSASALLPNFASSSSQQTRANGYGVLFARSPGPQQGSSRPSGW